MSVGGSQSEPSEELLPFGHWHQPQRPPQASCGLHYKVKMLVQRQPWDEFQDRNFSYAAINGKGTGKTRVQVLHSRLCVRFLLAQETKSRWVVTKIDNSVIRISGYRLKLVECIFSHHPRLCV